MTALDYSFERQIEMATKDNYERGIERGLKTGILQGATDAITGLIKDNQISMQEGAKRLNISEAELKKML